MIVWKLTESRIWVRPLEDCLESTVVEHGLFSQKILAERWGDMEADKKLSWAPAKHPVDAKAGATCAQEIQAGTTTGVSYFQVTPIEVRES